jgi:hypothetical protein
MHQHQKLQHLLQEHQQQKQLQQLRQLNQRHQKHQKQKKMVKDQIIKVIKQIVSSDLKLIQSQRNHLMINVLQLNLSNHLVTQTKAQIQQEVFSTMLHHQALS